jgi:hypothetical protein
MDEITKEWFSSARERYSGAVRFAFVILAVLLGIQLTTFTEYLETQARLKRAKAQAEEARALTAAMSEVAEKANALQQTVSDNLKGLLNRLVEDLKGDFAALDAKVADLRGDRPIPSEAQRNLAMQQLNAPGLLKREIVLGNDLEAKIKEASSVAQVSLLLTGWIEENIIRLRFAEVADRWKQGETAIVQKADALNETLRAFPSATTETNSTFAQRLAQLRTTLKNFPDRLAAVAFKPPADPIWWQTVHSKGSTAEFLEEDALKVLQTRSGNEAAAAAIGWPAFRRRELVSVVRLMERQEPESGRLVRALTFGVPQANRPPVNLRWLLAGVFAAVWVAITGWQLAAAGVLTLVEAAIQTVWGLLPIAVAAWYAYGIDCNLRNEKKLG